MILREDESLLMLEKGSRVVPAAFLIGSVRLLAWTVPGLNVTLSPPTGTRLIMLCVDESIARYR